MYQQKSPLAFTQQIWFYFFWVVFVLYSWGFFFQIQGIQLVEELGDWVGGRGEGRREILLRSMS